jgi:hypothetical protein
MFFFFCGKKYREFLEQVLKNSKTPLKNMGIGQQLSFYKQNINKVNL